MYQVSGKSEGSSDFRVNLTPKQKQATVALSTSEAEYIALCAATQEAVWLERLLRELGFSNGPVRLLEDNQPCKVLSPCIAQNPIAHSRTKHIDIKYHYIREVLQSNSINLQYPTSEMVADLLTKPLSRVTFERLRTALGINIMLVESLIKWECSKAVDSLID